MKVGLTNGTVGETKGDVVDGQFVQVNLQDENGNWIIAHGEVAEILDD
jgi:hypothetical protein